jgi:hypothetical protein
MASLVHFWSASTSPSSFGQVLSIGKRRSPSRAHRSASAKRFWSRYARTIGASTDELQRDLEDPDARLVQRQAFGGMIWSKQYFYYDVPEWLNGDPQQPPPPSERMS